MVGVGFDRAVRDFLDAIGALNSLNVASSAGFNHYPVVPYATGLWFSCIIDHEITFVRWSGWRREVFVLKQLGSIILYLVPVRCANTAWLKPASILFTRDTWRFINLLWVETVVLTCDSILVLELAFLLWQSPAKAIMIANAISLIYLAIGSRLS